MFKLQTHFWKIIAVAAVAGLFYVGNGLRAQPESNSANSLILTAESAEIVKINNKLLVTVSENGRTIIFWEIDASDTGTPHVLNVKSHTHRP